VLGDTLFARDESDPFGPIVAKEVQEVFQRTGRVLHVHDDRGTVLRTTPEHPFWVENKGWTQAGVLEPGDRLRTANGWTTVAELFDTGEYETVYNVRVADYHTYFVSDHPASDGVWAHNTYYGYAYNGSAQSAIDSHRLVQGLPAFSQSDSSTGTVSVIKISDGNNVYAAAGNNGAWGASSYSLSNRQRWLITLQGSGNLQTGTTLANYQSLSHAEAMVLMKLADQVGLRDLANSCVTINVDRYTCAFCQNDGGIQALKKYLKLKNLTIVDRDGSKYSF